MTYHHHYHHHLLVRYMRRILLWALLVMLGALFVPLTMTR
jgi:hypothetical protein